MLLLLPDRLTSRRAASRSSGSFSFSCFLSPILSCLNRPPSPSPSPTDAPTSPTPVLYRRRQPSRLAVTSRLLTFASLLSYLSHRLRLTTLNVSSHKFPHIRDRVSSLQEPPPDSLLGHPDQAYTAIQMKWTFMSVSPCEADGSSEWDSKFLWHLGFVSMNEAKYPLA